MESGESREAIVGVGLGETDEPHGPECPSLEGDISDHRSDDEITAGSSTQYCSPMQGFVNSEGISTSISIQDSPSRDIHTPSKSDMLPDVLTRDSLAELYRPMFVEEEDVCQEALFIREEFGLKIPIDVTCDITTYILASVGRILYNILGKRFLLLYNKQSSAEGDICSVSSTPGLHLPIDSPIPHLVIWATLFNKTDRLLNYIEESDYPVGFSVLSASMYLSLSRLSGRDDTRLSVAWKQRSRDMQTLASDITRYLRAHGRDLSIHAVGERMNLFGEKEQKSSLIFSPVELALEGDLKEFISSWAVQSYARRLFTNEIDAGRRYWVFSPLFWIPPAPLLLATPCGLVRYNTGKYLERPDVKEKNRIPDSLFFHLIDKISPLPTASLRGETLRNQGPPCKFCLLNSPLQTYYTAPVNVLQYYMISHLCILVLFTMTLIHDMRTEWIAVTWFFAFFLSDVHQILTSDRRNALYGIDGQTRSQMTVIGDWTISEKLSIRTDSRACHVIWRWFSDGWNVIKFLAYILLLSGFLFHQIHVTGSGITRILYACSLLCFYINTFRFFVLCKPITTTVIRLHLITKKLVPLFITLLLVSIAFGIVYVALIHPPNNDLHSSEQNTYLLIFRPLWHMFGAIHLEDMHDEMKRVASNSCSEYDFNMWDPGKWTSCYTGWVVPIFTMVFVFVANLVLFSYIIGVVSYQYQKTKAKAEKYWATQRYRLIVLASELSLPPPPINLIWFMFRLFLVMLYVIFSLVLRVVGKRKQICDPEELRLTFPRCFKFHVTMILLLTCICKSSTRYYTKSTSERRQAANDAFKDIYPGLNKGVSSNC